MAKKFFLVGFGSGDGSGKIDKRQGRPRRFSDPLQAMDQAELWAAACKGFMRQYFPDEQRAVKVTGTPAYWAALEAERVMLDAEKGAGEKHCE